MTTSSSASACTLRDALHALRAVLPPLHPDLHKGQCGRVAVLGGSDEYTGAPLFASLSSLRFGADLSYVCTPSAIAATSMKPYSPDIIVLSRPTLPDRIHAATIGPGLGRCAAAGDALLATLQCEKEIPLVLDADALFFVAKRNDVRTALRDRACVTVLTPNAMELDRLSESGDPAELSAQLSDARHNVVVLAKGVVDVACAAGHTVAKASNAGALRRCAGLGDVLAGVLATTLAWAGSEELDARAVAKVTAGAAALVREATRRAFDKQARGMLASDVVDELAGVVRDMEHGTLIDDIVARTVT